MNQRIDLGDAWAIRDLEFLVRVSGRQFVLRVADVDVKMAGMTSPPVSIDLDVKLVASEPEGSNAG